MPTARHMDPGTQFANYRIERVLGEGGMGVMYLAHDAELRRPVALKLLLRELTADADLQGRFLHEATTAARLDHPNIVTVYSRGSHDGQLWIAMQYVPGTDAYHEIKDGRGIAADRALRIVTATAEALDHAHEHGVLHRDVKPANILLGHPHGGQPERVMLTDFGIAKALEDTGIRTRTGYFLGSLQYAAPEQLDSDQEADHRVDVYALGATLFQLLTGSIPYPGNTPAQLMHGHLSKPVPRLDPSHRIPEAMNQVLATALAKDPADRYPSCGALADAAAAALHPPTAPPPPRPKSAPAAEPPPVAPLVDQARIAETVRRVPTPPAPTIVRPGSTTAPKTANKQTTGPRATLVLVAVVFAILTLIAVLSALDHFTSGSTDVIAGRPHAEPGRSSPLAGGGAHSLALTDTGQIVAWGYNDSRIKVPAPPAGQTYTAIAAGGWHSLALTSTGQVIAWGDSWDDTYVPAPPTGQTYTAIAAGGAHSLALTSTGQVIAWGSNNDGQTNVPAPPAGQTYTAIAAGEDYSLALTDTGQVIAWGYNFDRETDVPLPPAGQTYTAIAAGRWHSLALTSTGQVVAWGSNSDGQTNVPAPPAGQTYTAIAAGNGDSLVLTNTGQVIAWGNSADGKTDVPAALR